MHKKRIFEACMLLSWGERPGAACCSCQRRQQPRVAQRQRQQHPCVTQQGGKHNDGRQSKVEDDGLRRSADGGVAWRAQNLEERWCCLGGGRAGRGGRRAERGGGVRSSDRADLHPGRRRGTGGGGGWGLGGREGIVEADSPGPRMGSRGWRRVHRDHPCHGHRVLDDEQGDALDGDPGASLQPRMPASRV